MTKPNTVPQIALVVVAAVLLPWWLTMIGLAAWVLWTRRSRE